jgi:hypothetical protein
MFTLKLYRRVSHDAVITKVLSVHHVQTMSFEHASAERNYPPEKGLELWAFDGPEPGPYKSFLIGEREKHGLSSSEARDAGIVLRPEHDWWGWGLLENENGRTTEHFRPASYG